MFMMHSEYNEYTVKNYGTANSIYRVQIVKISQQFNNYPK